jgi:hypothetical protein
MANARLIRQNFFNDPQLSKYSIDERYLLIGLTCVADDFGRLWFNLQNIISDVFPTDEAITKDWVKETIQKLIDSSILCEYEVDGIKYIHFPDWFKKGWYLKQKIDHPKEFGGCPDCPFCSIEDITRKQRETSRAIKSNLIQFNLNEDNLSQSNPARTNTINRLHKQTYTDYLVGKYPLVSGERYVDLLNAYINTVEDKNAWDWDHRRHFEGLVMAEQDKLESK